MGIALIVAAILVGVVAGAVVAAWRSLGRLDDTTDI